MSSGRMCPKTSWRPKSRLQLERALDEGKPEHIAEKIVAGRMNKWYEEIVLMEQSFIKDDDKTVSQYLQETVAEVGETIQHRPLPALRHRRRELSGFGRSAQAAHRPRPAGSMPIGD